MNIKNFSHIILKINLFKSFSYEEILEIFKENTYIIKQYSKNNVIYFQNEKCNSMDVILKGEISVQKIEENGNILTVSSFTSGDVIGGNLLFSHRNTYPMTVVSKSPSIILHINKELILDVCQRNKDFLVGFIQSISDKTIILTDKIKAITLKTIRQCMIEFLTYEYYYQKTSVIKLEMSKKELAERLGIQRPSLSRELNKMRKDGLIDFDAHTITINDLSILDSAK